MPPEPARLPGVYVRCHGPRPVGPRYAGKSSHHGVHDVREPVAPLQCIAAVARGPRYLGQLASSLAMDRGQVVRVARHLAGLAQASGYLFSFLCIHDIILSNYITFSHKSIGLSNSFLLVRLRVGLRAARRRSLLSIQYALTVPRTSGAGP
jgi:hypothetical protein